MKSITTCKCKPVTYNCRPQGHRGSSPQIHTYTSEGHELPAPGGNQLRRSARSPSPLRAISLDIRCSPDSPVHRPASSTTSSPVNPALSPSCSSPPIPIPLSPRNLGHSHGRYLSPLAIPSRSNTPESASNHSSPMPPSSPLGAIQLDLYTRKEGPLFISRLPEEGPDIGRLHFRLNYDFNRSDLIIHIIEGNFFIFNFLSIADKYKTASKIQLFFLLFYLI